MKRFRIERITTVRDYYRYMHNRDYKAQVIYITANSENEAFEKADSDDGMIISVDEVER